MVVSSVTDNRAKKVSGHYRTGAVRGKEDVGKSSAASRLTTACRHGTPQGRVGTRRLVMLQLGSERRDIATHPWQGTGRLRQPETAAQQHSHAAASAAY